MSDLPYIERPVLADRIEALESQVADLLAALEKWKFLLERFYPLDYQPKLSVLDMFPGDKEKMLAAIRAAHQGEPHHPYNDPDLISHQGEGTT